MAKALSMSIREFIFSDQQNVRIKRHVALWFVCYVLLVVSYPPRGGGSPNGIATDGFIKHYEMVTLRAFFHLLCQLVFCYPLLYWLMPLFFWKKKYLQFISMLLLLSITVAFFRYAVFMYAYNPIMQQLNLHANPASQVFLFSVTQTINGPAFISFLFISLKFFRDWQQKQSANFTLQRENANAELQLLKAQVHPHFLFNTLNNIYSFVLNKDHRAAGLVDKLTGMIDYMRTEGQNSLVPLEKEIRLIKDYVGLERVRYGDRLDLQVNFAGDHQQKFIAPLIMIPFVENSFKHGTSQMLRHPWVKLEITCIHNRLFFNLSNSKPSLVVPNRSNNGIGLNNVKKRLQLLYSGKHQLDIYSAEDSFSVNMQLLLEDKSPVAENKLV